MKVEVHIWDWPLRLFHWLLVVAVVGAYATGKLGGNLTDWHARFGSLILGLLVFRLIWGFIGTTHARFASFFPTVSRLVEYVKGEWQGVGHNPAGAIAIIALLAVLSFLAITGLFANDDIAFEGPLFHAIDKEVSDKLSGWHIFAVNILLGLVAVHVSAIVLYQRLKKTNLVVAMLTGKKQLPKSLAPSPIKPVGPIRFVITLLIAVTVVWGVWSGGFVNYLAPLASFQTATAHPKT
ncbi:cytochrome b/b6 domain-containing protein [Methylomonas sp. 11b]|uniref:cytochrome b/b6 domain-containing protein n=1 Tax=Methylomonas sp. 11b TaxID=1168169 RepID=UPI0004797AFA|nr:cytochrome b/b6 domain-containing protein [Methylomonas sp. 11b]